MYVFHGDDMLKPGFCSFILLRSTCKDCASRYEDSTRLVIAINFLYYYNSHACNTQVFHFFQKYKYTFMRFGVKAQRSSSSRYRP